MKINKEAFNKLWNEVYTRLHLVSNKSAEYYYLSGCLDTMCKIQNELQEKEENAEV